MERTVRKNHVSAPIWLLIFVPALAIVAGLSYAAGAARGKIPVSWSANELNWDAYAPGVPLQVAKLWGDRSKPGEYGMLLKLPAGFQAGLHSHTADYEAVVVQGTWIHTHAGETAPAKELTPGSYVFQPGKQVHDDLCKSKTDCILFIHQHAKGDYIPAKLVATKPGDAHKPGKPEQKPAARTAGQAADKALENAEEKTAEPLRGGDRAGAMPADRK